MCFLGRSGVKFVLAMAFAISSPLLALAQSWPTHTVRIIVPFLAGASTDVLARSVAAALGDKLGKPFIVENRTGASGNIGASFVAKSASDGYTLLFTTPAPIVQNQFMYKDMTFDPDRDLQPIVLIANSPLIIAAKHGSPFKTLEELIAYAKSNPVKLSTGSSGQGTLGHITSELLQQAAGIRLAHIPYRGTAAVVTDLAAGQIDLAIDFMSSYVPLAQAGTIDAIAQTGRSRNASLPDTPTVVESGVVNFDEATAWYALMAPTGTPPDAVQKINSVVNDWLKTEAAKKVLVSLSMEPNGGTPEQAKGYIAGEVAKWGPIIKAANIQF